MFDLFDASRYRSGAALRDETLRFYRGEGVYERFPAEKRVSLKFHRVPHVMVHGRVSVADVRVIRASDCTAPGH